MNQQHVSEKDLSQTTKIGGKTTGGKSDFMLTFVRF
jgi:hypothetical protein